MMSISISQAAGVPRRAALGSFLGSVVEYYDFFIYGTAAALVFSHVFFPVDSGASGTLAAVATFGVGYIARPVGSVILGHFGDRIGRRRMLLFTVVLMGGSTFLIGLLPDYSTLGMGAPVLLVLLRLCQGLSAAGEQAGANSLTLEHAPGKKRALYTSWTMSGTQLGIVLGTLIFIPISALPKDDLFSWGWRVPFLLSAAFVAVVFFVRRGVPEPEIFEETKATEGVEKYPIIPLLKNHWRNMVRVVLCSILAVVGSVTGIFGLAYATNTAGVPTAAMLWVGVASNVAGIITMPFWAILSDRIGRKPIFAFGMAAAALLIFPYFYFIGTGNVALVFLGAILLSVCASGAGALQPAFYTEMFDTKVRFSGVAISTQLGVLLGGFAPTIGYALLQPGRDGWIPVAVFTAVCCAISAGSALSARETRGLTLHELGKNADRRVTGPTVDPTGAEDTREVFQGAASRTATSATGNQRQ
jgi:MFS family permease